LKPHPLLLIEKDIEQGEKIMKLAAEKNLNKFAFPVFNIKGRKIAYPFKAAVGNSFGFGCERGTFGPKNLMLMDILGTYIIHGWFNKKDGKVEFKHKIPTSNDPRVKHLSSLYISYKLLKYITGKLSPVHEGIIPDFLYSLENKLEDIDPLKKRSKKPVQISLTDSYLKQEVSFLADYSSRQLHDLIKQTGECVLRMNYPIRFFDGKAYQNFPFNNYNFPCTLFTLLRAENSKVSKDGYVLERAYTIRFDTFLGYFFVQNCVSCYIDLLPGKFYSMSDYSQLFYRILILPYYKNFKNPIGIEEIKNRLALKTRDTYMVRKVVRRILEELESNSFISEPKEEKADGKYLYSYRKNAWKELQ
jgi:hypothetical protein